MKPNALPRCSAGQVSETSAAPLAHSPPIPIPRRMRNRPSCHRFCASPQSPVKMEYKSTLPISARFRPDRSATIPKSNPPAADESSVTEPSRPASVLLNPIVVMIVARTIEYSITSKASSIHPNEAATSARWAAESPARHHPNKLERGGEVVRGTVICQWGGRARQRRARLVYSELKPHRDFSLPRRRVDVRQDLIDLTERRGQRVRHRRREVRMVGDVEQLSNYLHAMAVERKRLRQAQ